MSQDRRMYVSPRHLLRYHRIISILLLVSLAYCAISVYTLIIHSPGYSLKHVVIDHSSSDDRYVNYAIHRNTSIEQFPWDTDKYLTIRLEKVNPQDFDFIIENPTICSKRSDLLFVVLVLSIQKERETRDVIRGTWGSFPSLPSKLVFLFGTTHNETENELIKEEHREYGDIVQANFVESYRNLSYKVLMGLRWVSLQCRHVEYVLKSDTDTFVNIPILIKKLQDHPYGEHGTIYGSLIPKNVPLRTGKWAVPHNIYPLKRYPPYVSGTSYVISGNIVMSLYTASQHFPNLNIEDALITGCLRVLIGANIKHIDGFSRWKYAPPVPCKFIRDKTISASGVGTRLMYNIWRTLQNYPTSCNASHGN